MCLTTRNTDLYAFSLGEGYANTALSHDRYISVDDRCALQGFPPLPVLTALGLPESHAVHALGNAMAVPVMGAVMTSVLHGLDLEGCADWHDLVEPARRHGKAVLSHARGTA